MLSWRDILSKREYNLHLWGVWFVMMPINTSSFSKSFIEETVHPCRQTIWTINSFSRHINPLRVVCHKWKEMSCLGFIEEGSQSFLRRFGGIWCYYHLNWSWQCPSQSLNFPQGMGRLGQLTFEAYRRSLQAKINLQGDIFWPWKGPWFCGYDFIVHPHPNYLEEVYLVTALVPSDTACLANSPGNRRRTAVWISLLVMVDLLL